jgi:predicted outer membrane repeat protein
MRIALALVAASLAWSPRPASGAVVHVPGDQPTIASALAAAAAGDTVLLACGTYFEHGMTITTPLTIASETGVAGCATIDAEFNGRILWIEGASGVVFSGVTLSKGRSDWGSAVYADTAGVSFVDCAFDACQAGMEGGAVFYNCGTGSFEGCSFTGNSALYGGGIVVSRAACSFEGCFFGENEAHWGGGAAVYHPGATPSFTACDFHDNRAVGGDDSYGGGVYCWDHAAPSFEGCEFLRNTSEYGGGGLMSDEECQIVLHDCTFTDNSAAYGGGIETWHTRGGSVTSCYFAGNTAEDGGGVLCEESQGVSFWSCSFTGNEATEAGGGFDLLASTPPPADCTFTGNSAVYGGGIAALDCADPVFSGCWFGGNTAQYGGGLAVQSSGSPEITGSFFIANAADYGGALIFLGCSAPSLTGSTLVLNRATADGGGVAVSVCTTLSIGTTIVGFSEDGNAVGSDGAPVVCTATAIYGNEGGDWVGAIAGQEATNDNIASDPLFCGLYTEDYSICEDSPCLPENNGVGLLVGRFGQGCDGPCGAPVEARSWGSIKAMYR